MAEKSKEDVGPVNILVNNASIVPGTTVMDTKDSKIVKWKIKIRKVYVSMIFLQAFLPDMLKYKLGHIVTMASLAWHSGTNKRDDCSSKFIAVGLDKVLRVELFVQ